MENVLYLNVEMPCGSEPSDLLPKGTQAQVINTQDYHGDSGGKLLYVEFPNRVRTWVHEKWFDRESK